MFFKFLLLKNMFVIKKVNFYIMTKLTNVLVFYSPFFLDIKLVINKSFT